MNFIINLIVFPSDFSLLYIKKGFKINLIFKYILNSLSKLKYQFYIQIYIEGNYISKVINLPLIYILITININWFTISFSIKILYQTNL